MDIYILHYVKVLIVIIVTIYLIKIVFERKPIFKPENAAPSKRYFIKKHIRKFNFIGKTLILVVILFSIFLVIIPAGKDFYNWINKDFKIIKCVAASKSNDKKSLNINRAVQFIDIYTGKKVGLTVNYTSIEVDEYYTIEYLPNIKIGKIISKDK